MTDMNDDDILAKAKEIKAAWAKERRRIRQRESYLKWVATPEGREKNRLTSLRYYKKNKDRIIVRNYARFVAKREGHGDIERVLRRIEPEYAKLVDTDVASISPIRTVADDYLDGIQQHMGYLPQKG